jgi:hypothetical protein
MLPTDELSAVVAFPPVLVDVLRYHLLTQGMGRRDKPAPPARVS